jgi:hypothetical protein
MTVTAPAKCPNCGCPTVKMQVIAWGVFRAGKFETEEIGEAVQPTDNAIETVVCDNEDCGFEWQWEQPR